MELDKLLSSIATRLNYIKSNASAKYIKQQVDIIDIKLDDVREHVIKTEELMNQVCDKIIKMNIYLMKRVPGETKMVYKKMDELAEFIEQLRTVYFNANEQ